MTRPPHFRERNKVHYRLAHWPIWIFVFFIAPGPLTFDLFEHGFDRRMALWLGAVLLATGIAGWRGRLPGVEPKPYILRFTEDKPNPAYRRVCYSMAWNDLLTFVILNLTGLIYAASTGVWKLRQIYDTAYFPMAAVILSCGVLGLLPRVKFSTKGEGTERRYFYGAVWGVTIGQAVLGILWKTMPRTHAADVAKLFVYVAILLFIGVLSYRGVLPRTRPIVPGDWAISD